MTGNAKKLEEFIAILGPKFPHKIISAKIDLPEYQGTPMEVCTEKCREAFRQVGNISIESTLLRKYRYIGRTLVTASCFSHY